MKPTHERLHDWRTDENRKLTLEAAGRLVGVRHSTWSEWESGRKDPGIEKAVEVELVTAGEIRIEHWGYTPEQAASLRAFGARRDSEEQPVEEPCDSASHGSA
jgi:transcriptional regulator with XRE-family HTH domain